MCRETFLYLCEQLRGDIEPEYTNMRNSISLETRIAVTLWCLATTVEYRTIAHLFGISRSSVCLIVQNTCRAIVRRLMPAYIKFPSGDALEAVVHGFQQLFNISPCAGAIDGSHIPITPPVLNHTDYYNRKGWYSVILQAVVDHQYLFRDINVGWPGSVHDARVLAHSALFRKAEEGTILNGQSKQIEGCTIPVFLIGDSAYPLLKWLIKPYPENDHMTEQRRNFNYQLSRARIVVENAFGRLKARWRRLVKKNDVIVKNVRHVIAACCVLHNLCEIHGEFFYDNWISGDENELQQPAVQALAGAHATIAEPLAIRDALVRSLVNHNDRPTQNMFTVSTIRYS